MPTADHIAFEVTDLDRAVAFYTDKLGWKLLFHARDEEHQEAFAFVEVDGCNLELLERLDKTGPPPVNLPSPPYCPHFAITVTDIDESLAELTQKGVDIAKGPMEITGKVRWAYFADPDGNVIEFVQWMS